MKSEKRIVIIKWQVKQPASEPAKYVPRLSRLLKLVTFFICKDWLNLDGTHHGICKNCYFYKASKFPRKQSRFFFDAFFYPWNPPRAAFKSPRYAEKGLGTVVF